MINGLSLDEDVAFQHRSWRVQKVGQILVGLFVIAGLVGVFGGGGIAREVRGQAGGLEVEFPRFLRAQAPFELRVGLNAAEARADRLTVWIEGALLEHFSLEGVSPQPAEERLGEGRLQYEFSLDGERPPPIVFRLEAKRAGWRTSRIGVAGGVSVTVRQLVYP